MKMVVFTFTVLDQNYPFGANLIPKFKIFNVKKNTHKFYDMTNLFC